MIRVLVLANNSLLAEAVVTILAEEINLGEAWVSHHELGRGSSHSMVIFVDEGGKDNDLKELTELFRGDVNLLVIKVALEDPKIYLYESYQLNNPDAERIIGLVRDFSRANLQKSVRKGKNSDYQKKMKSTSLARGRQHEKHQTSAMPGYLSLSDRKPSLILLNFSNFFVPHHIRRNSLKNVTLQSDFNLFAFQNSSKFNRSILINTEVIS